MRARAVSLLLALSLSACIHPASRGVGLSDHFRHGLTGWSLEAEAGAAARVRAANGVLDIDTPEGLSLWWKAPITGPVTITFEVMAVQDGGPNDAVSDVNAFWMAHDPSVVSGSPLAHPRSGAFADYDSLQTYYVGIGGNRNTTTRLRRYIGRAGDRPLLPENDRSDPASRLVPNRWTRVRLVADGPRIAVDYAGKRLFALDDAQPYTRGWFAFRTTKSHLRIRHFRIAPRDEPHGD
ncbi:DUF6250 domain-containing protein [Novosphingobium sp. 1949]|uniref:DUF6250 domain-containing protein n=1 Tax=Novosphingobium organovorum TaxID=2930092 RepID=A0ABT0BCY2_9SPHN|nr:DUF6250 domain-containing protein [Novosphingobium organovorum]MCJ2182915.1 DUF6250 domain-containing protein [Novosphingobium organovorum]